MSLETTKTSTTQPTSSTSTPGSSIPGAPKAGITGTDVLIGALKLAGLAFTAYKAASHHKQQQQSAALSARGSSGVGSMASVDPNALLNMGLQHMRAMNRGMKST